MNANYLKMLDNLLGSMLTRLLPSGRRGVLDGAPGSILVIRPGGIGDALLLAPALLAIKQTFREARITVLAERRNAAAFDLCPAVDRVLLYDAPADLMQAMRGRWDVVIDSEQWYRLSAIVSRLARAPISVGFATNARKRLFSCQVEYSQQQYELESFFRLVEPLGVAPTAAPAGAFLSVPGEAAAAAERLLLPLDGSPFVAIFAGASVAEKRWGAERFRQVADHLMLRGLRVVVVGGEQDAEEGAFIVKRCRGLNLAGACSLSESAAVIARSHLLLSGDSGVLHLGAGLGVPTVSLFGCSSPDKWGPKGEMNCVLYKGLSCSPCSRFGRVPRCPDQTRCLAEISVSEVVSAVMKVLWEAEDRKAEQASSGAR